MGSIAFSSGSGSAHTRTFEEEVETSLQETVEKRINGIAQRIIHKAEQELREEIGGAIAGIALEVMKEVSIERHGHVLQIKIKDKRAS